MGKLILRSAEIENFKGIEHLVIEFSETRTDIFGANGTGKSTIVDAYNWCLWGKDSKGNSDGSDNFREKPLDSQGHEKHGLTTRVKLWFMYNDKPLALERVKKERWERKRGAGEPVYCGNTVTYFINGVETKAAEYKAGIASIASEEATRFIGTLGAFNAADWKTRRAILTGMCDSNMIAEKLAELFPGVAQRLASEGLTIDQLKKQADTKRKEAVKLAQELPVKIQGARAMLPETGDERAAERKTEYELLLDEVRQQIAKAKAELAVQDPEKEIERLKAELAKAIEKRETELRTEVDKAESLFNARLAESKALAAQIEKLESDAAEAEAKRERLRNEWKATYEIRPDSTKCPVCGQELPEDKRDEIFKPFEKTRLEKLREISECGKAASKALETIRATMLGMTEQVEKAVERTAECQRAFETATRQYEMFTTGQTVNTEILDIKRRIGELTKNTGRSPETSDELQKLMQHEADLKMKLAAAELATVIQAQRAEAEKTIEKLTEELTEAQGNAIESERTLAEIEEYSRALAELTEQAINRDFSCLKWRLFTEQVNGERGETCVCMIPCGDSLVSYYTANTASQINADIEIVKMLKKHYDAEMPLFVDNKERVNELTDTDGIQVITLAVSDDIELRIERR